MFVMEQDSRFAFDPAAFLNLYASSPWQRRRLQMALDLNREIVRHTVENIHEREFVSELLKLLPPSLRRNLDGECERVIDRAREDKTQFEMIVDLCAINLMQIKQQPIDLAEDGCTTGELDEWFRIGGWIGDPFDPFGPPQIALATLLTLACALEASGPRLLEQALPSDEDFDQRFKQSLLPMQ